MHEGIHLYSLSSIYAAFECIMKMYRILDKNVSDFDNNRLKEEKILKSEKELQYLQTEIKNFINEKMYDKKQILI